MVSRVEPGQPMSARLVIMSMIENLFIVGISIIKMVVIENYYLRVAHTKVRCHPELDEGSIDSYVVEISSRILRPFDKLRVTLSY